MRDDADELARGIARQPGIRVEREAVPYLGQDRQVANLHGERRVRGAPEELVELLDLAALALPAHPPALALVPLAQAMEEEEPIVAVALVERLDAGARGLEDRCIGRDGLRVRIAKVAEHGEMHARVGVAERLHLEVLEKFLDTVGPIEHRRNDHHRPG